MAEAPESEVSILRLGGNTFFVERFLRMYPEVARVLRAAGAYIVVFAPAPWMEELEGSPMPSPEIVARRTRLALEDAVRAVAARSGVPVFVAAGAGCYFYLAVLGEAPPLIGVKASRGLFVGFVDCGEGGANFFAPDGREGPWEVVRDLVMEQIERLGGIGVQPAGS